MKVYLGIKFHSDNSNREAIEQIAQALEACGCETICIQRDIEHWGAVRLTPQALMPKTFEVLRSCQLVVIDLTEKGVGLGIEAGYAYAHGIPVITIARVGADISPTLQGISRTSYLYRGSEDLKTFFAAVREQEGKAS
jgi:nucleoside 2-deoxyribosyltransferase